MILKLNNELKLNNDFKFIKYFSKVEKELDFLLVLINPIYINIIIFIFI